ncbi:MAG: DUF2461 domain-containing protein [Bacteroidales bacterium]|jgi:uncharacterized protein (TIGR02453 family)|nr:DUF2461 domain-containing protein [Bacteroidales bacterium]
MVKDILTFLENISKNNDRQWFNEHKNEYLACQKEFNSIAEKIIYGVAEFDKNCRNLTLKDCTYRFYRDIRFSKDKSPYKNHFGVFVCPGGKKSCMAGYYFHIEPNGGNYLNNSQLDSGTYCPTPKMLRSIREDIVDFGEDFEKSINKANHFSLSKESSLIKNPKDFQSNKYDYMIRLRNFLLYKPLDKNFLLSDNLVENVVEEFRSTLDFVNLLNRAILYCEDN